MSKLEFKNLKHLFPEKTEINNNGILEINKNNLSDLVKKYGSPLYIYDENTIRNTSKRYVNNFKSGYENVHVSYSSKAFSNPVLSKILLDEGLGIDVVSGGELEILLRSKFPMKDVNFHGNNKSKEELIKSVKNNIGLITVDSFFELDLLNKICKELNKKQDVTLRLSPSVDPHTHELTSTGILDTKFGFSIETGAAKDAISKAVSKEFLNLKGIHFHLGSPIFELNPYKEAIDYVFKFVKDNYPDYKNIEIFNVGGGFAVPYSINDPIVKIEDYASIICKTIKENIKKYSVKNVKLVIEPGRAIVARSGVAIYTIGGIKEIPNLRKYVSVDGGMADNIRPALYGSKYSLYSVNKANLTHDEIVTIAGKYCETGDKLTENVPLADPQPNDLIAIPVSGAYNFSMSSNYNVSLRPAILLIKSDGNIEVLRRKETYNDILELSGI
ncbi:MAG: diaminopimelate decarboxylase [Dehalococcoidia bacterium]|tara:strand:+ start:2002 stop:3330 length:1329 start_codon:yes stop_codon:yes gene_type:complete